MRCPRCGKDVPNLIVSIFNRDQVCMDCIEEETNHPKYEEAIDACKQAEKNGDTKFEGIGWTP